MNQVTEPTASVDVALAHASRLLATDPALAAEQAGEILRVVDHPMARLVLGVSHSLRGQHAPALDVLEPLARAQPRWAQAQMELGLARARAGRDGAIAALRRAVALKPDLPQAWRALGDQLLAADDLDGADAAYAAHVRHSVRDPQLLAAASALNENRIPDAEALLRVHLKQAPSDVAAIRMFAEVAARLGRIEDSELLLQRCLELAPGFHEARRNYAMVLHRANKPAEALAQIDALLQSDARNPAYRNLKAVVLCRVGDYEPAIALYAELLKEFPLQSPIWLSYGHALKTAGHQARAIEAYREAIAREPAFGEAWWSLANLKTFRFSDEDIAAMRAQLARMEGRDDADADHRLHLHFALGKALEDRADYAASFQHYEQGNAQRLQQVPYSADETSARVRHAKRLYTPEFFAQRQGFGSNAPDPIFIVGLPRAGSTLLEQILSSHSQVEGTMELPELISVTRALKQQAGDGYYHDALATLDADAVRALGERYLEGTRIHRKSGAPFFIDKMPNNFAHVGLIQLALPNAKIIDARRHPLACCFSAFKQHFARGQSFSYSLQDLGRYYRDYVELMAHFDAVLPGRVHRVTYERMVDDTENEVRRLLAYCGLPFEEQCLRFFENERPVRTASSEQVRQPIYRDGVDHWKHFEPWLGPLQQALGPVLDVYPAVPDLGAA
ncbi:tetratricopeptide repeat-containing sulfotransferase family protein [Lysobacter tyrosinilyticus]